MLRDPDKTQQKKISPEFAKRLSVLNPHRQIRAIILLDTAKKMQASKTTSRSTSRKHVIAATRDSAERLLPEIDAVIKKYGGERLAMPNSLGSIPIETTVAGIQALSKNKHVKAIFENQRIKLTA